MRLRPALVLAAPAGVLGGHAIGYLAAPGPAPAAAVHHGYLALVLAVAVPLAVLAVAWAATAGAGAVRETPARDRGVALGPLLVAQWVLFAGQEVVEHVAVGHGAGAALASPALWCGLAAQVLTALAVVVLLRASAATGARLVALAVGGPWLLLPLVPWRPRQPSWSYLSSPAVVSPSRGPPATRFV